MYFPILTAKQNEIFALNELHDDVFLDVVPILILPRSKNLKSQLSKLLDRNIYFILVLNAPKANYPKQNEIQNEFIDGLLKNYNNYSLGYIVDSKTSIYDVNDFFKSNPNLEKSILHFGKFKDVAFLSKIVNVRYDIYLKNKVDDDYITKTANGKIIYIEDGFKKKDRNTDYPISSEFSNWIFEYEQEGIYGFSDFTIIGKEVPDGGGSPFAIALHLSKIDEDEFIIHHFVSDSNQDRKNQAGKFTEALNKLIYYIDQNPIFEGGGVKDFRNRHTDGHFPGLGICKKMAIKNHIEQVSNRITLL